MYKFIDVNEASEGLVLPSEALKINGEYIENLISGYRTLNVSGREALSPDVVTYTVGVRDGSKQKSKRYPERIITVTYQLIAATNEEFREAYNQLGKILDVEDAELIFNDEQDKFFKGTPCTIGSVPPGKNSVIGKFEILCADPFKYSVDEFEAVAVPGDGALFDYNGTYKSYPTLVTEFYDEKEVADDGETLTGAGADGKLSGAGDCGYVAFFNESEKIIQLGNPDEADGVTVGTKSQTLINQAFTESTAWGSSASGLWTKNSGNVLAGGTQNGSMGMVAASHYTTYGTVNTTDPTIKQVLYVTSTADDPYVNYLVTVKTSKRTATSVYLQFIIQAQLRSNVSYMRNGISLGVRISYQSKQHNVIIKGASQLWKGTTVRTASVGLTLNNLTADSQEISNWFYFSAYRLDSYGTAGTISRISLLPFTIPAYTTGAVATGTKTGSYMLGASGYGSASGWHGASIARSIPADALGAVGAENFTLTYKQKMCMGSGVTSQRGAFQANIVDNNGANIAGIRIYKNATGKTGNIAFYVNGSVMNTETVDLQYGNSYFGLAENSVQTTTIAKSGSKITFQVGSLKKQYTVPDLADVQAKKVVFMFEQYSTYAALAYNGLYWVKFVKDNCNTYKDVPNKFSANDVLEADCRTGEIYLNGISNPALGALGNDWEDFYITPGLNQIGVSYSDWVSDEYAPSFTVRYREVYL